MSDPTNPGPGTLVWTDLTVENAEPLRDYYRDVEPEPGTRELA